MQRGVALNQSLWSCLQVLLTTEGTDLVSKLLKMQQLEDDDELAYTGDEASPTGPAQIDGRPSWMKTLHNSALTWLQLLPKSLQVKFRLLKQKVNK